MMYMQTIQGPRLVFIGTHALMLCCESTHHET